MYLSRIELDPIRRSTMTALAAPQKFHGAVESAFSGERRRRLWRLDRLGEKLYLLLLSEEMPDLSGVVEQFGTGAAPESRNYDPLLAVTYEGVLQVTDPEAFRNLLCQGMGRGKAYGLGLLTVMRGG